IPEKGNLQSLGRSHEVGSLRSLRHLGGPSQVARRYQPKRSQEIPASPESQPPPRSLRIRIESNRSGERRTPRIPPRVAQKHRPREDDRRLHRSPRHHPRRHLPGPTPHHPRTPPNLRYRPNERSTLRPPNRHHPPPILSRTTPHQITPPQPSHSHHPNRTH